MYIAAFMRINCHAHVHNLQSLNGSGFRNFLKKRLAHEWKQHWLIEWLIERLVEGIPNRREIRAELLDQISVTDDIRQAILSLNKRFDHDASVELALDGNLDFISEKIYDTVLDKVMNLLAKDEADQDARTKNVYDLLRFILRGLAPTIDALTKEFVAELEEDDVFVALMMDICDEKESDNTLFKQQIQATTEQIFKYPGRILPFVKANPHRQDVVAIVKHALANQGCVGVKIYPSLGYRIDDPKLLDIFRYCSEHHYPVLMHCNMSGFIKSEEDVANCQPNLWRPILEDVRYSNLTICFGHFGDEQNLVGETVTGYTQEILELMRDPHFGQRVFADISYHVDQLHGIEKEIQYFTHLKNFLNDPVLKSQILFGSDSFLVQQQMTESHYWEYFAKRFSPAEFELLTVKNPVKFLGLPYGGQAIAQNFTQYIQFIEKHVMQVTGKPASWLKNYLNNTNPDLIQQIESLGDGWDPSIKIQKVLFDFMIDKRFLAKNVTFDQARDILLRRRLFDHGDSAAYKRGKARKFIKKLKRQFEKDNIERNNVPHLDVKIIDYIISEQATIKQFSQELDIYYDA